MHLTGQIIQDWYYLAFLIGGFGTQAALMSELPRRHRLHHGVATASGAGAGASTGGMVACCAHHLADLAPFIGATGAAVFLTDYRIAFMILGVNAFGVVIAAQKLRRRPANHADAAQDTDTCIAACSPLPSLLRF